ncbi:hypothetical protein DRH29_01535 [candidate division Kazan bacterium]|mgnify:CR=1 FL=1|uniref:Uncharacterized protein n=1 Tax=candidate division Kazan bacterium TaxID=2202143 RepID=A0A420ZCY5_UNCK3|nr:MAG: hypothetical protein DRH29_01535 [candidate division Kazan bacterium]
MALVDIARKYFQRNISRWISWLAIVGIIALSLGMPWPPNKPARASGEKMILLWDTALGGSIPTGWTNASATYGDKFLRGDSVANVGLTNAGTHIHTQGTVAFVNASSPTVNVRSNKQNTVLADAPHGHSIQVFMMDPATILPVYRNLIAITYDSGIPTTLPQYAIAIFDSAVAALGFTDYTSQDGYMIRIAATSGGTGGSTTHTHTNLNIASDISDSNTPLVDGTGVTAVIDGHIHTYGPTTSPASTDHTPLHTEVDLRYVTSSGGTAIPPNMIAMFDGDPNIDSSGWDVISDGGEAFGGVLIEAQTTYQTGQGYATHTHALNVTSTTHIAGTVMSSGSPSIPMIGTHSHTISGNFSTENNVAPYINVVVAKKQAEYTPDSRNWRWYDAEDVADPNNTNGGETTTGDAISAENTLPTNTQIIYKMNAIKLRIVVGETGGGAGTDVKYRLQFDTTPDFSGTPTLVGGQGSLVTWRYYDGDNVNDDDDISTTRLSGSPSAGRHNEDNLTGAGQGSTFDPAASTIYEHEFTIQNFSATANAQYWFRLQYTEDSIAGVPDWQTVALNGSYSYPTLRCAGAYDLELYQVPSAVFLGTYTLGGGGTLVYVFQPGEEIVFWDKTGLGNGYDVVVSSMSLVCNTCGPDTIPGADITWTAPTTVLYGSFASDKTGITAPGSGSTLDSNRTAYSSASSVDPTVRTGGFFFLPTITLTNLNSRAVGEYTGTLLLTIS